MKECAEIAYEIGYEYFGVQHYGECYGKGTDYAKHGANNDCDIYDKGNGHAVGKKSTNFVYRLNKRITEST